MREVPPSLAASLAGPATTLAYCWRLTRTDGAVLGFTDHDETLQFDGTAFEAATGLTAGEAEAELGLAAGTQEVEGALSSLAIDEADIRAGRYDGAKVEIFLVDWQQPGEPMLLEIAELGEVRRGGQAFTAELRGIESRLDQQKGRIYRRRCDAVLGDARCGVDVAAEGRTVEMVLLRETAGALTVSGLDDPGRFAGGRLTWLSGDAAGLSGEIAGIGEGAAPGETRITLVEACAAALAPGDRMRLVIGCDKSFETCRGKFANGLNFRGFPHIPGTDAALGFAKADADYDGSPVVA